MSVQGRKSLGCRLAKCRSEGAKKRSMMMSSALYTWEEKPVPEVHVQQHEEKTYAPDFSQSVDFNAGVGYAEDASMASPPPDVVYGGDSQAFVMSAEQSLQSFVAMPQGGDMYGQGEPVYHSEAAYPPHEFTLPSEAFVAHPNDGFASHLAPMYGDVPQHTY